MKKESKGTVDQLYTDKMFLKEVKRRKKNLAMGWIDYQKAYNMAPHSWVIESLNVMGIVKNVVDFFLEKRSWWPPALKILETLENPLNFFLLLKSPLKTLKFGGFLSNPGKHKCQPLKPLRFNPFSSVLVFSFHKVHVKHHFALFFKNLIIVALLEVK